MDLNLLLWGMGTLFTLSLFSLKVGLGLAYSEIKPKGIAVTLLSYFLLFLVLALSLEKLVEGLKPLLAKGPYLHIAMALGMFLWGIYLLKTPHKKGFFSTLPLLIPCPVCLSAIFFSLWFIVNLSKIPAIYLGVILGALFVVFSLLIILLGRIKKAQFPEVNLALSMIALSLYYLLSLYLPQKIEEAKTIYYSFAEKGSPLTLTESIGVLAMLIITIFLGYLKNILEA